MKEALDFATRQWLQYWIRNIWNVSCSIQKACSDAEDTVNAKRAEHGLEPIPKEYQYVDE